VLNSVSESEVETSEAMKVVGLISGGKDSIFALLQCIQYGHEVVALANLHPPEHSPDEMDSFTFQTVGHNVVVAMAGAMGLPLYRHPLSGSARNQDLQYAPTALDEVEDLWWLLSAVRAHHPDVQAVSCGAILSTYQRTRVENVCCRLGLVSLAYLWQRDQAELLREMIAAGVDAVLIKVASSGLYPRRHLLKSLASVEPQFRMLAISDGLNVCGEGGEYESLVLHCPLFQSRIVLYVASMTQSHFAPPHMFCIDSYVHLCLYRAILSLSFSHVPTHTYIHTHTYTLFLT
jgi:diphthine-ammonia ligase